MWKGFEWSLSRLTSFNYSNFWYLLKTYKHFHQVFYAVATKCNTTVHSIFIWRAPLSFLWYSTGCQCLTLRAGNALRERRQSRWKTFYLTEGWYNRGWYNKLIEETGQLTKTKKLLKVDSSNTNSSNYYYLLKTCNLFHYDFLMLQQPNVPLFTLLCLKVILGLFCGVSHVANYSSWGPAMHWGDWDRPFSIFFNQSR